MTASGRLLSQNDKLYLILMQVMQNLVKALEAANNPLDPPGGRRLFELGDGFRAEAQTVQYDFTVGEPLASAILTIRIGAYYDYP